MHGDVFGCYRIERGARSVDSILIRRKDRLKTAFLRQTDAISLPFNGTEIEYAYQFVAASGHSTECDDVIVLIVCGDPGITFPAEVVLPKSAVFKVKMIERSEVGKLW